MKQLAVIVLIGIIFHGALAEFSIATHCTKANQPLKILLTEPASTTNFLLIKAYTLKKQILGKGEWAEVKALDFDDERYWPKNLGGITAVKMLNTNSKLATQDKLMQGLEKELKALYELRNESWVPRLYACVDSHPIYYIAQEKLSTSFEDIDLQKKLRNSPPITILKAFMPLFKGLAALEKHNYVHNDIKPGNIMNTGPELLDLSDLRFVDFGFANQLNSSEAKVSRDGAPLYLSRNRQVGRKHAILDDVYALVVTLADILDNKTSFFYEPRLDRFGRKVHLEFDCFRKVMTKECSKQLVANGKALFAKFGFGYYTEAPLEEMNATTLFAKIIEYDTLATTPYNKILAQLDRLSEDLGEMQKKPEEPRDPSIDRKGGRNPISQDRAPRGGQQFLPSKYELEPAKINPAVKEPLFVQLQLDINKHLNQRVNDILNKKKVPYQNQNKEMSQQKDDNKLLRVAEFDEKYENLPKKQLKANDVGQQLQPAVLKRDNSAKYPRNYSADTRLAEIERERKKRQQELEELERRNDDYLKKLQEKRIGNKGILKADNSSNQLRKRKYEYHDERNRFNHKGLYDDVLFKNYEQGYHDDLMYRIRPEHDLLFGGRYAFDRFYI